MIRDRYTPQDNYIVAENKNWTFKTATAKDVTNGNAKVAGDLILVHKTGGTKDEWEA